MRKPNLLATAVDRKGRVVVRAFGPPNALCSDADALSKGLYLLTEVLIRGLLPEERGGGLGGEFGYGANYENAVFMLHRYCWCEKPHCNWCSGKSPNFRHKQSGLEIKWYKWIGRSMEMNRLSISGKEWSCIVRQCFASLPKGTAAKAERQRKQESTPRFRAQQRRAMEAMMKAVHAHLTRSPYPKAR